MYQIKKVFNVIFKLNDCNDDDVQAISFSTRYQAKQFYNKCKEQLIKDYKNTYGISEEGYEAKGDMITWTDHGPYYYVRLVGCELCSAIYRIGEYFKNDSQ